MFTTLTIREVPLLYEIFFDEKRMFVSFSLCPEVNEYFLNALPKSNIWASHFQSFSPFVYNENSWGFGGAFQRNDDVVFKEGWIAWECFLPEKATRQILNEFSGNIKFISDIMEMFIYNHETIEMQGEKQLMTIDGITVGSGEYLNQGDFGFSFSFPVLEFCRKIWEDEEVYKKILEAMQKTWNHLRGQKKCKSLEKLCFHVGQCQGNERLVYLRCPGEGTFVGAGNPLRESSHGMNFSSHNVDTKVQQLTLLVGAIKIANLAREDSL